MLERWPVLPETVRGDVLEIAKQDGEPTRRRLKDVAEALVVVARVLVGEGVTEPIREEEGWDVVATMTSALVRHVHDYESLASRLPTKATFADRLDRVMSRRGRKRLTSWFWANSLLGHRRSRFFSSVVMGDRAPERLAEWLSSRSGPPNEVVSARQILQSSAYRQHLTDSWQQCEYRTLEAILTRRDARDFTTGERIAVRRMFAERKESGMPRERDPQIDAHHLIPQKWPPVSGLPETVRLRVTRSLENRTPLARITNIRFSNRSPAVYIAEIERDDPAHGIEMLLTPHLVDAELLRCIADDLEGDRLVAVVTTFLDNRLGRIAGVLADAVSTA
jgi:hypothetical protein